MDGKQNVMRLTPLDHLMPRTYIGVFLTFQTTQPQQSISSQLQEGMNQLLRKIPWLSGRVHPATSIEGKQFLELRWHEDRAIIELIDKGTIPATYTASSDARMPPETVSADIWPVSIAIDEHTFAKGAPALAASLFQFADGQGIGLCVCAHHNVVDATGLAEIMKFWTRCISKESIDGVDFSDDRCGRLSNALCPHLASTAAQPTEVLLAAHPEYSTTAPTLPVEFSSSTCRLIQIPLSRINEAKRVIEDKTNTQPSTNAVLSALLWSTITRARCLRTPGLSMDSSKLVMAVNGRGRVSEELTTPNHPYFSNVVLYSVAGLPVQTIISTTDPTAGISQTSSAIAQASSPKIIDARFIAEAYSLTDSLRNYATVFPGWDLFGSRDLTITSWSDLDLYSLDFGPGLGTPQHVRAPYSEADGVCLVLPRNRIKNLQLTNYEVLEVMVMLRTDDMDKLEQLLVVNV